MKINIRQKEAFHAVIIILMYCLITNFFNARTLVESGVYSKVVSGLLYISPIIFFEEIQKSFRIKGIPFHVASIAFLFVMGVFSALFFWRQSIFNSVQALRDFLPLLFFFFLIKFKFSNRSILIALISLSILYVVCYFLSISAYPNNYFGYIQELDEVYIERVSEARGVLRLIGLPGNDLVVFVYCYILVKCHRNRAYMPLLLPLLIMVVLRGSRTPFFMVVLLSLIYYISLVKDKLMVGLLVLTFFLISVYGYNVIMESRSDNVVVNYIQMTDEQINGNKHEDIRVKNTKYFFSEFIGNPLTAIVGNGIPKQSGYSKIIEKLKDKGFYLSDVGITSIFVFWGVVGLFVYGWLFVTILRTSVNDDFMYGKLFAFYMFMILPTNVAMLSRSPILFAISLYLIYKGSTGSVLTKRKQRR